MSSPPRVTRFPSSDSFEFVSPQISDSSLFSDGDDGDDGNDIVLSPRHLTSSLSSSSIAVEEQDFVLVPTGSSLMSSPDSRLGTPDVSGSERHGRQANDQKEHGSDSEEEEDHRDNPISDQDDADSVTSAFNSLRISTPRRRTRGPLLTDTDSEPDSELDTARAFTPTLPIHSMSPSSPHFPATPRVTSVPGASARPPLTRTQKRASQRARAKVREALASVELGNVAHAPKAVAPSLSTEAKKKRRKRTKAATTNGSRAVEDKAVIDEDNAELYDNAVRFMSGSLESPSKILDKHDRLALCQALLIELGVTTTEASIPRSHKAAKALLQSTVHINIVDYLAVRHQGLAALRKVMHPSRKALRATLHKKRAKLSKVKACGLHALLVSC